MSIRARAELDGMLYTIRARNCEPSATTAGPAIHSLDIDLTSAGVLPEPAPDGPTPAQIDAMAAKVNGWLDQAGLEDHAVVAAGEADGRVRVTVRPLYEGVAPLPCEGRPANGQEQPSAEEMVFLFDHNTLIRARWSAPMEALSSLPLEKLMSLRASLAAAGLEDALAELDWQFGYEYIPAANGTLLLVPAYRHADGADEVIVSAADGALIADTRSTDVPSSPTPVPQVTKIEVRWGMNGPANYAESGYLSFPINSVIDLCASWYPPAIATPEWTVDDQSVVTVQPDETGIHCLCQMVGRTGTETTLHVKVNEMQADIRIVVG